MSSYFKTNAYSLFLFTNVFNNIKLAITIDKKQQQKLILNISQTNYYILFRKHFVLYYIWYIFVPS